MTAAALRASGRTSAFAWLVFAGVALINVSLLAPGNYSIDGNSMLSLAHSLAHHGTLTVPCAGGGSAVGQGGDCYSNFYPLLSVLLVPFVLVGDVLGDVFGLPSLYAEKVVALLLPALAAAGAAALVTSIAGKLGASRRASVGAACAFAFGTEALTYARTLFAETLAAFFVALAVWGLTESSPRRRSIGYAALALAVLAKPQMIVVGPGVALALAVVKRSWRPLLGVAIATAAGGLVYLGYNALRFGDAFKFGEGARSLHGHMFVPLRMLDGLGVFLISPGRGLIWFSPVAIVGALALWRTRRAPVAAACLGGAAAILLFYSGQIGDKEWATRYLVPALPLACVGVALVKGRTAKLAAVLVAIGLIASGPTLVAFFERYFAEQPHASIHALRWERLAVARIWPVAVHEVSDARHTDVNDVVHAAGGPRSDRVRDQRLLHVVAQWWWMLPAVGISRWLGLALCLLGVATGAALLWRASGGALSVRAGPLRRGSRAPRRSAAPVPGQVGEQPER